MVRSPVSLHACTSHVSLDHSHIHHLPFLTTPVPSLRSHPFLILHDLLQIVHNHLLNHFLEPTQRILPSFHKLPEANNSSLVHHCDTVHAFGFADHEIDIVHAYSQREPRVDTAQEEDEVV